MSNAFSLTKLARLLKLTNAGQGLVINATGDPDLASNYPMIIAPATASNHAVRSSQLSADNTKFPTYSEGTWTPVLSFGATAQTGVTATGSYKKIGSLVFGLVNLLLTTKTGTGNAVITGFPLTAASNGSATLLYHENFASAFGVEGRLDAGASYIVFGKSGVAVSPAQLTDADFNTNTRFNFTFMVSV